MPLPYMTPDSLVHPHLDVHGFIDICNRIIDESKKVRKCIYNTSREVYMEKHILHENDKVAVIGDIHGGLCNVRNFVLRLKKLDFFKDDEYTLRDNHRVVSLGDLVDRGPSSLQVVHFLFSLKCLPANWDKVLLVNGNHETADVYNSADNHGIVASLMRIQNSEMVAKHNPYVGLNDVTTLISSDLFIIEGDKIHFKPFTYMSCVLFLRYEDKVYSPHTRERVVRKEQPAWVQLCHGGIDDSLTPSIRTFLAGSKDLILQQREAFYDPQGLVWTDFEDSLNCCRNEVSEKSVLPSLKAIRSNPDAYPSGRVDGARGEGTYRYKTLELVTYLMKIGAGMILRGHQDLVEGFMTIPYKWEKPDCRSVLTAYVFPIKTDPAVRLDENYNRFASCQQNPTSVSVTDLPNSVSEWVPISEKACNKYRDGEYQHCVPNSRCENINKNHAYKIRSSEVALVTTATCTEARQTKVESFMVMEYNQLSNCTKPFDSSAEKAICSKWNNATDYVNDMRKVDERARREGREQYWQGCHEDDLRSRYENLCGIKKRVSWWG